jgi:cell wall-associated NlpC family hydrolase
LRAHTLSAVVCSLTLLCISAPPAVAGETGGVVAATSTPAPTAAPAAPKVHTFPITARSPNIAYSGPVYEKTAAGAVVPYTPVPLSEAPGASGSSTDSTAKEADSIAAATAPGTTAAGTTAPEATEAGATGGSAIAPTPTPAPDGPFEGRPELEVPGTTARYVDGLAAAPMSAPLAVQQIIWAGNELIGLPYIYGGGHASFISPGYDCSGTVSFALHGANLLATPEDSSEFEKWGSHGAGRWVTIFSNPEHAYMTVAGLRLDTSAANDPSNLQGPRWRPLRPANEGFTIRHPLGV